MDFVSLNILAKELCRRLRVMYDHTEGGNGAQKAMCGAPPGSAIMGRPVEETGERDGSRRCARGVRTLRQETEVSAKPAGKGSFCQGTKPI